MEGPRQRRARRVPRPREDLTHDSAAQRARPFYLSYEGPLPAASPKEVKVDITIREQLVRPVENRPVLRGYEDLPEDAPVRVYALEEIAVEKLVALTDKARNEPRDLYDLWHLTSEGLIDFATLVPELDTKLAFRGRTRNAMTTELADLLTIDDSSCAVACCPGEDPRAVGPAGSGGDEAGLGPPRRHRAGGL
ncbi:MAG: nucleotidyl transferase AbiEii/AbiGii toxin family protein [Myxococcota bacterium]|nr:nucleotidyl transferase AbiEii/AbiGii toxin family protein [Myxococcota bacterium]